MVAVARGRGWPAKERVDLCSGLPTYETICAIDLRSTPSGLAISRLKGLLRFGAFTSLNYGS